MSESYKSGSVRGVRSNAHPYRDKHAPTSMQPFRLRVARCAVTGRRHDCPIQTYG